MLAITVSTCLFHQILDVNIKSAALLVKEAHPHLQKSKNGSVVLVSSIGGLVPFAVSSVVTYS